MDRSPTLQRDLKRFAPGGSARIDAPSAPVRGPAGAVGRRTFLAGLSTTALGTLASRVMGLARDVATAALLGESFVMDALVIALRVPNLFRRLFGEGALAACFVPSLAAALQRDRHDAWRLTASVVSLLAAGLAAVVLAGELVCAALWFTWAQTAEARLVVGLSATLLPYLWFLCVAAQLAATLQTLGRFAAAAGGAMLLNVFWLAGVCVISPRLTSDPQDQAYLVAGCVLASGAAQVALQSWALWAAGFRWRPGFAGCRGELARIARRLVPLAAGLGVAQLGALAESLLAWLLSAPPGQTRLASAGVWWLGGAPYPLAAGTAASIYYAERFYQLPVGMIGAAAGAALFPLLSRHAARERTLAAASHLGQSLRLVWFLATPILASLALLAEPLIRLTLQHGHFTSADSARAAGMLTVYAFGAWAMCALPSLVRACYALDDYRLATRAAIGAAVGALILDVALAWPCAERGLALATTIAVVAQAGWLLVALRARYQTSWATLVGGLTPTLGGGAALVATVLPLDALLPDASSLGRVAAVLGPAGAEFTRLFGLVVCGGGAYVAAARMLESREWIIISGGLVRGLASLTPSRRPRAFADNPSSE